MFFEDFATPAESMNLRLKTDLDNVCKELNKFDGWYIAGGFALALLKNKQEHEPIDHNDIDIFFESEEAFQKCLKFYISKHQVMFESKYAVSFDNKVQFVCYSFGAPEVILETFDLNICRVAYIPKSKEIVDIRGFEPEVIRIMNPTNYALIHRIIKYAYRDFSISTETLLQAKELMTNDGLSEYNAYGENTHSKMTPEEFDNKISGTSFRPKVWFEYFKDRDFLSEIMDAYKSEMSIFGVPNAFLEIRNIKDTYNDNQYFALLKIHGKLIGEELNKAKYKYPEAFL